MMLRAKLFKLKTRAFWFEGGRDGAPNERGRVVAPPEGGVKEVRVAIFGFGGVGRELARLLAYRGGEVERRYGVRFLIVAVADSRGAAVKPEGFTGYELLKLVEAPRGGVSSTPWGRSGWGVIEVYGETLPDIHVEATPSDYSTGEPGLSHAFKALREGAHFVTANKAPLALRFWELVEEAFRRGVYLGYKATVMAGTPLVSLLRGLRGYRVRRVEGVLNATTNYILTLMEDRLVDLSDALRTAIDEGVAEPDPRLDLEGWDAAAKIVIVANTLGIKVSLGEVRREPLKASLKDVISAARRGSRLKYLAVLEGEAGRAWVGPAEVPRDSVLGMARGVLNAVRIDVGVNVISLSGKGGGVEVTAHALLSDMLEAVRGWVPP